MYIEIGIARFQVKFGHYGASNEDFTNAKLSARTVNAMRAEITDDTTVKELRRIQNARNKFKKDLPKVIRRWFKENRDQNIYDSKNLNVWYHIKSNVVSFYWTDDNYYGLDSLELSVDELVKMYK